MDESGDNGLVEGSTDFFILAGISIEDRHWKEYFWKIQDLRRQVSQRYGIRDFELKGAHLFSHRGAFFNSFLKPEDLEWIYDQLTSLICDPLVENFAVIKSKIELKSHAQTNTKNMIRVFTERTWREFLSMYEQHILEKSKRSGHPQNAIVYFDFNPGQERHVRKIVREFSRKLNIQLEFPTAGIVEDVIFRDSKSSHFIQLADVLAFSISRIVTGQKGNDAFTIKRSIIEKLEAKAKVRVDSI